MLNHNHVLSLWARCLTVNMTLIYTNTLHATSIWQWPRHTPCRAMKVHTASAYCCKRNPFLSLTEAEESRMPYPSVYPGVVYHWRERLNRCREMIYRAVSGKPSAIDSRVKDLLFLQIKDICPEHVHAHSYITIPAAAYQDLMYVRQLTYLLRRI